MRRVRLVIVAAVAVCLVGDPCLGLAPQPNRWAILIGAAQYDDAAFRDLEAPPADVEALRAVLTDPARGGFPPSQVIALSDAESDPGRQPRFENIVTRLQTLKSLARGCDYLFIYFSGHGFTLGETAYLIPADASWQKLQFGVPDALALPQLEEVVKEIRPRLAVTVLDACRDNPFTSPSDSAEAGGHGVAPWGEMTEEFQRAAEGLGAGEGRAVIFGCDQGQQTYEYKGRSVFTQALLEALNGAADANRDGAVTLSETRDFLGQSLKKWSLEAGHPQTPLVRYEGTTEIVLAGVPSAPAGGDLVVESQPLGASVWVNGRLIGRTPLTVRNLVPGDYHLLIGPAEGYGEQQRIAHVSPNQETRMWVQLPRLPDTGGLEVSSEPGGADVYVDGVLRGQTPLRLTGLPADTHDVRLTREGYWDYTGSVLLHARETAAELYSLRPVVSAPVGGPQDGFLAITSEPSGVEVWVDGALVGRTPVTLNYFPVGEHHVEWRHEEWTDEQELVAVRPGRVTKVHRDMSPATGFLEIATDIEEATIGVTSLGTGEPAYWWSEPVPTGTYSVTLSLPLGEIHAEAEVRKGGKASLEFPRAQFVGAVTVLAGEGPLYIDDLPVDDAPPCTLEGVPAGEHVIRSGQPLLTPTGETRALCSRVVVRGGDVVVVSSFQQLPLHKPVGGVGGVLLRRMSDAGQGDDMAAGPGGSLVATPWTVVETQTGRVMWQAKRSDPSSPCGPVAVTLDGTRVALRRYGYAGGELQIHLYILVLPEVSEGQLSGPFLWLGTTGDMWANAAMAYQPNGRLIAAQWEGGEVEVPDGMYPGPARARGARLNIWNALECRWLRSLDVGRGWIRIAAISPDASCLVLDRDDERLEVWDVFAGRVIGEFAKPKTTECVAVSPGGMIVAVANAQAGVELRNGSTGALVRMLKTHIRVQALAFSVDGKVLVCNGSDAAGDWFLELWE